LLLGLTVNKDKRLSLIDELVGRRIFVATLYLIIIEKNVGYLE